MKLKPTRMANRLVGGAFVAVLLTATSYSESLAQQPASSPDEPLVLDLDEVEWGPPGNSPRFPRGVRTAQVGPDPDTGGPIYFANFPAGSHFDLHWHSHTEYVSVLSGELTIVLGEDSHALSIGSYIVIPARMNHSWDVPSGGEAAVILVRRRGPADFHFVDP